jgi:hypothetical protein
VLAQSADAFGVTRQFDSSYQFAKQ